METVLIELRRYVSVDVTHLDTKDSKIHGLAAAQEVASTG